MSYLSGALLTSICFGMLPYELSCLNQVELELCKISRVGGKIFTLYTGSHTSIKSHHTLYYNKPEFTSKVFNYYKQHNDWQQENNNEINNNDESTTTTNDNSNNNNTTTTSNDSPPLNIQVVLTGPFTIEQRDIVRSRTTVCVNKVICGLKWLQKHNGLYRDFNFDEHHIYQPTIIDLSNTVESQDSNIEKG